MYKDFAYVYDRLMSNVNYEKWVEYIEEILRKYGKSPETIADIACGTGGITNLLARRGYKVTGVDISGDMLSIAREKARKAGLNIPYICQDIRELELHRPVDAITCMCDGFNYILSEEDFITALAGIYRFLKPGGILIFDISSRYKLSSVLGNKVMADADKDVSLIWSNKYKKDEKILQMDLTFFVRDGKLYKRFDETHFQKAYEREDVIRYLEIRGFKDIGSYAPFSLQPPGKRCERIFFAAVK